MKDQVLITKTTLIEIFSKNRIEAIEINTSILIKKFRVREYKLLLMLAGYKDYYDRIKSVKDNIEFIEDNYDPGLEQAIECLNFLREKYDRRSEDFFIAIELIKNGIYRGWEKSVKEIFDNGESMISEWRDFFFSYTNRNCIDTNDDFSDIIIGGLGETEYNENKENYNCLAKLIVKYLKHNRLTSFYDRNHIRCGDDIEDKVLEHCCKAFSFIQLIERAVFDDEEDKENWCHKEYEAFNQWIEDLKFDFCKRHFFFVTEEDVFPADEGHYQPWIMKIKGDFHIGKMDDLDKRKLRSEIDKLAKEVIIVRDQILDHFFEKIEEQVYAA